jgi:ATP-dependent Clp protease protease subunit
VLQGAATDLSIEAQEILRLREILYGIIAKHSHTDIAKIQKDCDRNLWLDPTEAMEYGLLDRVLERQPEITRRSGSDDDE